MTTLADAIANPASITLNSAAILAAVDGLEALATTLNGYVDQLEGYPDTLETLIGATNTKLDTLNSTAADTSDQGVAPHQPCKLATLTPAVDTSLYAAGDVLFATVAVAGIARANDVPALLQGVTVIDKAKQNAAITLAFYQANVTSAAANAANAMSDSDQATLLGMVDIAATDWKTWANNSTATMTGAKAPNLMLAPVSGGTTVYVVGYVGTGSTPTYTSTSDLVIKLGIVQG